MNFNKPEGANRGEVIRGVAEYLDEKVRRALDEATRTCLNCEHFIEGPPDRTSFSTI